MSEVNYITWPIKCVVRNPPWEPPSTVILDGSASPISTAWSTAESTSFTSCDPTFPGKDCKASSPNPNEPLSTQMNHQKNKLGSPEGCWLTNGDGAVCEPVIYNQQTVSNWGEICQSLGEAARCDRMRASMDNNN